MKDAFVLKGSGDNNVPFAQVIPFNVFPNPATDVLHISGLEHIEQSSYRIYNPQGQVVKTGLFDNTSNSIMVSSLRTGYYILHIGSPANLQSVGFIKK